MRTAEPRWNLAGSLTVWAFVAAAFFLCIGRYPLSDNNEGLYAGIAADMLHTRHFVIPQLEGLPYIEKPPLLYWMMGASFALFGPTAFAARLVPAAAAFGTCIALSLLLRRLGFRREAHFAALVFASSVGAVSLARIVLFDMLLTLGLTVALSGVCIWCFGQDRSRSGLRIAAIGLGIAVLAKGLVALVLFCAILLALAAFERVPVLPHLRRAGDPIALALFLGIVLPWHVAAALEQKDFTWFYFVNEHVLRFCGLREPHDFQRGPWHFYVPRLLVSALPWVWVVPAVALEKARPCRSSPRLERSLLLWAFVPLIFFSLSQAKANYYTIVCLPPLAAWLALRLGRLQERGWRALAVCAVLTAGINLTAIVLFPTIRLHTTGTAATALDLLSSNTSLALTLGIVAVGAPLAAALLFRTRHRLAALGLFGLPTLALVLTIGEVARAGPQLFSVAPAVSIARAKYADAQVFIYASPEKVSSVIFYSRDRFRVVDSSSADFRFAQRHHYGQGRVFIDSTALARSARDRPALLVVPKSERARFYESGLAREFIAIAATPKAVLWSNVPAPSGRLLVQQPP